MFLPAAMIRRRSTLNGLDWYSDNRIDLRAGWYGWCWVRSYPVCSVKGPIRLTVNDG
jgi:hypothetical protein